eukprot:8035665-Alexandrium_andersonii.AAC.1
MALQLFLAERSHLDVRLALLLLLADAQALVAVVIVDLRDEFGLDLALERVDRHEVALSKLDIVLLVPVAVGLLAPQDPPDQAPAPEVLRPQPLPHS